MTPDVPEPNADVEPVQMYETTIRDNKSHKSVFFCTVPARSLPLIILDRGTQGERELTTDEIVMDILELRPLFPISNTQAQRAMALLLDLSKTPLLTTRGIEFGRRTLQKLLDDSSLGITPDRVEFTRYLVESNVVPFEASPLGGVSIEQLLMKASQVGFGGYIGFVVAGNSPLLLIAVPAGMVICGAASGLAHGLEEGLRTRIKKLISDPRAPRRRSPPKS
jgi:hypothetical protein